jgi:hypothetical protein
VQVPVISGNDVSIPSLEHPQSTTGSAPDDQYFERHDAPASREIAARFIGDVDLHIMKDANAELLKRFEVPGGRDIATRLLHDIEVRVMLSKSRAAETAAMLPRPKQSSFVKPAVTDRLAKTFGGLDNAVAVVCRFAGAVNEMAASKSHSEEGRAVYAVIHQLLGDKAVERFEVDKIVNAVSKAQGSGMASHGSCTATDAIRFLSFENIWQRLTSEQRYLVTRECQNCAATGSGLMEGVQAFAEAWRNMPNEEQDTARANLSRLAHQSFADSKNR